MNLVYFNSTIIKSSISLIETNVINAKVVISVCHLFMPTPLNPTDRLDLRKEHKLSIVVKIELGDLVGDDSLYIKTIVLQITNF